MYQQILYRFISGAILLVFSFNSGLLQAQQQDTCFYLVYDQEKLPTPPIHFIFDSSDNSFISGRLTEYYESGQPKAQGQLFNGWRTGSWKSWAKDGSIIHQRTYSHPASYVIDYPKLPSKGPAKLFNTHSDLARDNGLIAYKDVKEYEVYWEKRLWLDLKPAANPLLFEEDRLLNHLKSTLDREDPPRIYTGENDRFRYELNRKDAELALAREKDNITGIRLKTVWFFNKITQRMNRRILGLAFLHKTPEGDHEPLLWFYYPEIRPLLAEITATPGSSIFPIQQLEDHFHFWEFNGQIIKESNIHDRYINEYIVDEGDQKNEHLQILLNIYGFEHDAWIFFNQGESVFSEY